MFHFSCQSGLSGRGRRGGGGPVRQHKRRMWWTESSFQSRCFRVDMTEAQTALCHWGPTNRDCAVVMWPHSDLRVEAINSNYTPHLQSTGLFLLSKRLSYCPRVCFHSTVCLLLHSKLIADSFIHAINWPAAIILTQWWRFQFWLFIHFIFVVPDRKMCCLSRSPDDWPGLQKCTPETACFWKIKVEIRGVKRTARGPELRAHLVTVCGRLHGHVTSTWGRNFSKAFTEGRT